jgi:methylmalonyl-CoA/ethylmalonyl-CoA epimerase
MIDEVKVNYIDHISIAVKDLNKAVKEFEEIFGWKVAGRYADPDENLRVAYFQVGPTAFELMEDLDGTGEVAKFIERRGEGIMLVGFNVDDCVRSIELLKERGAKMIDEKPRLSKELNRQFAFVHLKSCSGVLTEVIEGKY